MKKSVISLAVAAALSLPAISVNAIEVVDKKLEVYGKFHMSIDSSDRDDSSVTNDGTSISSNSSRLGFKGELPAGDFKVVYKIEQEVKVDSGDGGTIASRNTFAGLKGGFGQLIAGHHDTPFKTVGSKWGVFGDTVGERRAILGASYKDGNKLNVRAKNAVMYSIKTDALKFELMHAVDGEDENTGSVDNNDITMTSVALHYKAGPVWLAVGNESWEGHSKAGDVDATRVAASYKFGQSKIGLIYETIDSDTDKQWKRDVTGINAVIGMGSGSLRAQYLVADSADDGVNDTGASKVSVGYFHKLDKKTQVYLAYGATDNDKNAKFQAVDGGHGDEVKTKTGASPSSVSVGLIAKF